MEFHRGELALRQPTFQKACQMPHLRKAQLHVSIGVPLDHQRTRRVQLGLAPMAMHLSDVDVTSSRR
ncbi:hypothetical protein ACVFZB_24070, partial [Escherichia coli]